MAVLSVEKMWRDAAHGSVETRSRIAQNVKTPGELLHWMTMDGASHVVEHVLANPNVWESDLRAAVKAGRGYMVTANPSLSSEFIEWAYQVSSETVRAKATSTIWGTGWENNFFAHPNCSHKFMELGARSTVREVRVVVAKNLSLPESLAKVLVEDTYLWVLRNLVHNAAVADHILYPLLKTRDLRLLKALAKRFSGQDRQNAVNRIVEVSVRSVAASQSVAQYSRDPEHLKRLAYSPNAKVRNYVIKNPVASEEDWIVANLIG